MFLIMYCLWLVLNICLGIWFSFSFIYLLLNYDRLPKSFVNSFHCPNGWLLGIVNFLFFIKILQYDSLRSAGEHKKICQRKPSNRSGEHNWKNFSRLIHLCSPDLLSGVLWPVLLCFPTRPKPQWIALYKVTLYLKGSYIYLWYFVHFLSFLMLHTLKLQIDNLKPHNLCDFMILCMLICKFSHNEVVNS